MARKTTKYALKYKALQLLARYHERKIGQLRKKTDHHRRLCDKYELASQREFDRLYNKWFDHMNRK